MKKILTFLTSAALSLTVLSGSTLAAFAVEPTGSQLNVVNLSNAEDTVNIKIGSVVGEPGQVASVPVTISGAQPIAGMVLAFQISPKLILESIDPGDAFRGSPTTNAKDMVYVWYSSNGANQTAADGSTILTLNVKFAPESISTGDYDISIIQAESQVRDQDGKDVPFSLTSGKVTLPPPMTVLALGDINDDNLIDADDAVLALREYAKSMVSGSILTDAQKTAADVNGDKVVDADDAVLILKYYAKFMTNPDVSWEDLLK